jgi:hypothetical protein
MNDRERVNGLPATGNPAAMRDSLLATSLLTSLAVTSFGLPRSAQAEPAPLRVQLRVPAERANGVLAAVAAELDRPVVAAESGTCAAPCLVIAMGEDAAVADVRYIGPAGESRARAVSLPTDSGAAAETIGLLADNLVRDEASDLLAAMAEAAPVSTVAASAADPASATALAPPPVSPAVAAPPSAAVPATTPVVITDVRPRTFFSVGLIPPLSADLTAVGKVRHGVSVDLLVGVSGGTDGFSVSGVVDIENGLVDGVQLGGVGAVAERVNGGQIGGAISIAGTVDGAQIGGAAAITGGLAGGVQIGGAAALAGGKVDGFQIGGAAAIAGGGIDGFQIGGAAALAGGAVDGVQIGGAGSIAGGSIDGLQIGGAAAIAGGGIDGFQIGGAAAFAGGAVDGLQIGGAVAAAGGGLDGLQIGGAVSIAGGTVDGLQLAGALNVGGDVDGVQIAPFNVARRVDGVQVGVVNVATAGDGASIGLVTIVPGGRTDVEASVDTSAVGTVMLRHGSRHWHNVYGVGGKAGDEGGGMVGDDDIWMYGLGMGPTWYRERLTVDLDAMAWQVNLGAEHEDDVSLLAQLRLSAGYDLGPVTLVGGIVGNAYISTFADARDIDLASKADLSKRPPSAGNHDGEARVTIWPTAFVGLRL